MLLASGGWVRDGRPGCPPKTIQLQMSVVLRVRNPDALSRPVAAGETRQDGCRLARDREPPVLYSAVQDADAGRTDGSPSHTCPGPRCPID